MRYLLRVTLLVIILGITNIAFSKESVVPSIDPDIIEAILAEGRGLVKAIMTVEKTYFSEYGKYTTKWKDINTDIDLTKNKYFITPPAIIVSGNSCKATVKGSGEADWVYISINQNGDITPMNIKRAIASEAQNLVASIRTQERIYFSKNNRYTDKWEDISAEIDLTNNKFFITPPVITASGNGSYSTFKATIKGSGEAEGVTISIDKNGSVVASGLE